MKKFTFLIDLGSERRTVTWSGTDAADARQLVWAGLKDADKLRVRSITLVTATGAEA